MNVLFAFTDGYMIQICVTRFNKFNVYETKKKLLSLTITKQPLSPCLQPLQSPHCPAAYWYGWWQC